MYRNPAVGTRESPLCRFKRIVSHVFPLWFPMFPLSCRRPSRHPTSPRRRRLPPLPVAAAASCHRCQLSPLLAVAAVSCHCLLAPAFLHPRAQPRNGGYLSPGRAMKLGIRAGSASLAQLGSARLGSARLGSARRGAARRGAASYWYLLVLARLCLHVLVFARTCRCL